MSLLTIIISSGIPAPTPLWAQSPAKQDTSSAHVSGIPNRPDLVTVVPFATIKQNGLQVLTSTAVMVMADVNGHRGVFQLDLGAPWVTMSSNYFRPTADGGVDTVSQQSDDNKKIPWVRVHVQLRMGSLLDQFEDPFVLESIEPYKSEPAPARPVNAFIGSMGGLDCCVEGPLVGNIGLAALEPFETIIDYTHRRVVLIRLDSTGRRLVQVPAYTPRWTTPLLDITAHDAFHDWGIAVRPDDVLDTLNAANNTRFKKLDSGAMGNDDRVLGYPFLRSLRVVGFNHQTHQFLLYR